MAPIKIELVDENLQDSDLLAMVSRGEIAMTLVDSHKAKLWCGTFLVCTFIVPCHYVPR